MDIVGKQSLVDSYENWYHKFDFGDGVFNTSRTEHPIIWDAIESTMNKVDFKGKSVLDIGCWDGYWSFMAERKGAKSVLATDCLSQRWGDDRGFQIARELFDSKVQYDGDVDVYLVEKLEGQFDVILFFGVFYHLQHMTLAFAKLRRLLNPNGLLLIEGATINDTEKSYMEFYCGREGNEPVRMDRSNWTCPTRRCLIDVLKSCYFEVEDELSYTELKYTRSTAIARAVEKGDDIHAFPAAFGLGEYDLKFQ